VLRRGLVAAMGTVEELTRRGRETGDSPRGYRLVAAPLTEELIADFRERGAHPERVNGHVRVLARDAQHLNALVDSARSRGALLTELTPEKTTLEDVFVELVRAPEDPS